MNIRSKTVSALLICFFLALGVSSCLASEVKTVNVTLPWLTRMARFIVGSTINIQPMNRWTPNGTLQNLRKLKPESAVIALDPRDAAKHKIPSDRKDLYLLYENLPVSDSNVAFMPFDPSILPFLSQRMLIAISKLEPGYYPYYQRRLAEFQSRLESTLEVGRSLIRESKLLDLTGATSPWIMAASDNTVRPPAYLWAAWTSGARLNELTNTLDEANRRGLTIVMDIWTPASIKSKVPASHNKLLLDEPAIDYDFFEQLHDVYLEIWNATTRK